MQDDIEIVCCLFEQSWIIRKVVCKEKTSALFEDSAPEIWCIDNSLRILGLQSLEVAASVSEKARENSFDTMGLHQRKQSAQEEGVVAVSASGLVKDLMNWGPEVQTKSQQTLSSHKVKVGMLQKDLAS